MQNKKFVFKFLSLPQLIELLFKLRRQSTRTPFVYLQCNLMITFFLLLSFGLYYGLRVINRDMFFCYKGSLCYRVDIILMISSIFIQVVCGAYDTIVTIMTNNNEINHIYTRKLLLFCYVCDVLCSMRFVYVLV